MILPVNSINSSLAIFDSLQNDGVIIDLYVDSIGFTPTQFTDDFIRDIDVDIIGIIRDVNENIFGFVGFSRHTGWVSSLGLKYRQQFHLLLGLRFLSSTSQSNHLRQ
jgi:hypothetical protein